ncbi:MAG: class II glutamine amidotransferase [Myxococcales bacterium]|nr:class II glutamine amidotransferase [Myxococcales bacterium]
MSGRLIGYMANRADRFGAALEQESAVVDATASDDPSGYGVGFYQGGEVLLMKRPLFERTDLHWSEVVGDVQTDCAVAHLRRGMTVGAFRTDNTHPFRMRQWLFAHNGAIDKFEAMRERLMEQLPDFIRRNLRGQTDSEHFFHLILSFLHDSGQLDNPDIADTYVLPALRSSVAMLEQLSSEVGAAPPTLNLVLATGRRMYALRWGRPMMIVERESDARTEKPVRFRYTMVVGGAESVPAGYRTMEDRSIAIIDRNLKVTYHPV